MMFIGSLNIKKFYTVLLLFSTFALLLNDSAFAAENPDIEGVCGMDIVLVLDESQSISNFAATDHVRSAANAFITAISGTGSRIQITEFNGRARTVIPFTEVRADNESLFKNYINNETGTPLLGYNPAGYGYPDTGTNWEDAFRRAIANETSPLLVFVTDGDPTNYLVDPDNTVQGGNGFSSDAANILQSYQQAVPAANLVKQAGTHILIIGVGPALTGAAQLSRLTGVSGPDVVSDLANFSLNQTDVLAVSEFADLNDAFRRVALSLCVPSVAFTKLAKDINQTTFQPEPNWEFSATVEAVSSNLEPVVWKTPARGSTDSTQTSVTDGDGSLTFQWAIRSLDNPLLVDSMFTWDETLRDYAFVDANCKRKTFHEVGIIETTFSLQLQETITVGPHDLISCTVRNERNAALDVIKTFTHNDDEDGSLDVSVGDTLHYTITATNTGDATLTNVVVSDTLTGDSNTCASVLSGDVCVLEVSYIIQAGDVGTTIHNVGVADSDQTDPVEDSEDVPVPTPSLDVVKTFVSNADEDTSGTVSLHDTLTYIIQATNTGSSNLTNVTINDTLTGDQTVCAFVAPGATCELTVHYIVTQADVFSGNVHNVGVADSDQTPPTEDPENVPVPLPLMDICKDGKPMGVFLRYDGSGAEDDTHEQTSSEVIVEGDPQHANPVYIVVYDHHKDKRASTLFSGTVNLNGHFYVTGTKRRIPPRLRFHIFSEEGGELLQVVQFHTSCSQPLNSGDTFGSIMVLGQANFTVSKTHETRRKERKQFR